MQNDRPAKNLSQYIDYLQSKGNYILLRENAINAIGISDAGFNMAVYRLAQRGRIINVRQGFYIIVPLEYKNAGGIPASWFIDSLMQFHKLPYYVGLLSAAALYEAAHQQPQEFQVITNKKLRPVVVGRVRIKFFLKREINSNFITRIKTVTGYMNVSTPELTAIDFLKYINAAGQINNVATVIAELAEAIDSKRLLDVARESEIAIVQRLGYLLDTFANKQVTDPLYEWFSSRKKILTISLVPKKSHKNSKKNKKWNLFINEKIEIDE